MRRWQVCYLLGCLVFGATVEVLKARGSWLYDERAELGNLSAPWLLIAFAPALHVRSVVRAAAVGLLATLAALAGFYVAFATVLAGHLGDHGGPLGELAWVLRAGAVWFVLGLVTGPLMGSLGSLVGRAGRSWALLVAGLLLAGEPGVLAVFGNHPLPLPAPLDLSWAFSWTPVYLVELAAGAVVLALVVARRSPRGLPDEARKP